MTIVYRVLLFFSVLLLFAVAYSRADDSSQVPQVLQLTGLCVLVSVACLLARLSLSFERGDIRLRRWAIIVFGVVIITCVSMGRAFTAITFDH